ncbi:MAG: metallophosphoesterase [Candidatus Hodarchaeota archaeon]
MTKATKIIAIADLHQGTSPSPPSNISVISQEKLIRNLIRKKPEGILIAGDLQDYMWEIGTNKHAIPQIKEKIKHDKVFNALNEGSIPVFFVWGNTDVMDVEKSLSYESTSITNELRTWFCEEFGNFTDCHNKIQYLNEIPIIGYEDANKTMEDHSGKCWDEPEIIKDLKPLIQSLTPDKRQQAIIMTHAPPRGVLDFSSFGNMHIGSYYLRELIEDYQPMLSVFGHVHFCGGYSEFVGRTQCINTSSFGLAISHEILFGQSSFELKIKNSQVTSTKMIVQHFWEGKQKKYFVEYRKCQICGRHTPFARKEFKTCRVCLGARRIRNKLKYQQNT